ncbi:MAG: hypothetical protein J2P26_13335, partial [Nocardiopsaceae bacterium]|nr:hypothetical protein [Nocardiopsaceae bacterium]
SDDFLDKVASVLRLSDAERSLLYLYAVGRAPGCAHDLQYGATISKALRDLVSVQPYPAYISDPSWELICHNSALELWFPTLPGSGNIMRWVFLEAQARQQLYRWKIDWAPPMLAQLRMAKARAPEDQRLESLLASILSVNSVAREIWSHGLLACSHPDGDIRRVMIHGQTEAIPIEIVAVSPLRAPDCRMVILYPLRVVQPATG